MGVDSPLVIGGTGGSGTRVVAEIVRRAGRYMGLRRNHAEDAMPFAMFDWRWGLAYLQSGAAPEMEEAFETLVENHLEGRPHDSPWGWKAPHSYLLLPFLHERFPRMRFVHVVRDGRDMALSRNQWQVRHYGSMLAAPEAPEAVRSAAWWDWANGRARELGAARADRYLLVRLEDLCQDPIGWTERIVAFSGGSCDESLSSLVAIPDSLGRWRRHDPAELRQIEATCRDGLRRFGYLATPRPSGRG